MFIPKIKFNTKKPPNGPSVQSNSGGLKGSRIGFRYSQTVRPIQPAITMMATVATVMKPLVRRLEIILLSSMEATKTAPMTWKMLNMRELRERVRILKYRATWEEISTCPKSTGSAEEDQA